MASIGAGSIVQLNSGEILTVEYIRREYDRETLRYNGDTNPTPAGSIAVKFEGPALDCRVLRPGTFRIIKR